MTVKRYYGSANVTKSLVEFSHDGTVLLRCEAREIAFADYEDGQKKMKTSCFCMQRGEFDLKFANAFRNPLCLKVKGAHNHRGLLIYCDTETEMEANAMLLGYADAEVAPNQRRLKDVEKCRRDFVEMLYRHMGEEARLIVMNEGVEYDKEEFVDFMPTYL